MKHLFYTSIYLLSFFSFSLYSYTASTGHEIEEVYYLATTSPEAVKHLLHSKKTKIEEALNHQNRTLSFEDTCEKELHYVRDIIGVPNAHEGSERFEKQVKKIKESAELALEQGSLDEALIASLFPFLKTEQGKKQIFGYCLTPTPDYTLSYHIVSERKRLINLLVQHSATFNKISYLLEEIEKNEQEKKTIQEKVLQFLEAQIPGDLKGWGGKNASLALYTLARGFGRGIGSILLRPLSGSVIEYGAGKFLGFAANRISPMQGIPLNKESLKSLENLSFPSIYAKRLSYFMLTPWYLLDVRKPENHEALTSSPAIIGHIIGAKLSGCLSTSGLWIHSILHNKSLLGNLLISTIYFWDTVRGTQEWISLMKNSYEEIKTIYTCLRYLSLLEKKITLTKELLDQVYILQSLSSQEYCLPEYKLMDDFLHSPEKYSRSLISSMTSGVRGALSYALPGSLAHGYFNKIEPILPLINTSVDRFIGFVDSICAAAHAASTSQTGFSLATLHNKVPFTLELKNFWHPKYKNAIRNSVSLCNGIQNALLISPTGSGKTVLLSTLLVALHFANLGGLIPAEYAEISYCNDFFISIKEKYEIGGGLSGHMNELQTFIDFNEECSKIDTPCLVIFDEPFLGHTNPQQAARLSEEKLPWFLQKENIFCITATHDPALKNIMKDKRNKCTIWYLEVEEPYAGMFKNTYKVECDETGESQNNWWFNDHEKATRYERWLEAGLLTKNKKN